MSDLISPEYLAQQKAMHAAPRGYGAKGDKWAEAVDDLATQWNVESVLDYGCGQGSLGRALRNRGYTVADYDPAIAGKDGAPKPADLVACTDVLEHCEPDRIDAVLDHIQSLTGRLLFVVIATGPAGKLLPNGENAHILQRPDAWWDEKLMARFKLLGRVPCREHKEYAAIWGPAL